MEYKIASPEIMKHVGGNENIKSFGNCMTRLRINVINDALVNVDELKAIAGVMGVVKGDQIQIIVGPGHAQRLKDAFAEICTAGNIDAEEEDSGIRDVASEVREKVKQKQTSAIQRGFRHIGNIFIPIIPGFVACGIILSIANIIRLMSMQGVNFATDLLANPWFGVLAGLGAAASSILYVVVGYNSGKEFGGSPILGAIAGALIYLPALNGIVATDTAVASPLVLPFVNIELKAGLGGVLGVVFAAYVFAVIEKRVRRVVSATFDLFLVPFITVVLGSIITIFIVIPISALLMNVITYLLVDIALEKGGIFGGYILAAAFLPLVMIGLHHGLTPIHQQLIETVGYTTLLPILAMAGGGQIGMAIAVYIKTKDKKLRQIISSGLPIGILGVAEPLIYGVSLPLFYPFVTACLGAGFGGAVISYAHNYIEGFGSTGMAISGVLMTFLMSGNMWIWYLIGLLVSYVAGFILTYFFGYKDSMLERLK